MLEEVVFVLNSNTLRNERMSNILRETTANISDCGYSCSVVTSKRFFGESRERFDKKVMLMVADEQKTSERLLQEGFYCVGMKHEGNGRVSFPKVRYIFSDIGEVDIDSFVKVYQRHAGEPWEILRTERLLIRETTVEDVDEFYKIYKDPDITRYMEGLFEDPEDEKRYQRDYIEKVYGLMGFGVWTLVNLEDGAVVGRAGYSIRNGFDDIELGFLVGLKYQGKGYATEACRAILDYGKNVLKFENVQTLVKAENEVSIHLCEKLGFKRMDEVDVEENIYGNQYKEGQKAANERSTHGKYIRMRLVF
ncbi:MAG: GNAT family N-acetyltransferase [Butyrivibrio sp.]|nr:GNAT family N-acetyltransferase [Butyrivibrio sp.]